MGKLLAEFTAKTANYLHDRGRTVLARDHRVAVRAVGAHACLRQCRAAADQRGRYRGATGLSDIHSGRGADAGGCVKGSHH